MRTQVAIVGGGPAGLLLNQRLHLNGIESIVLERQTREHVLSRVRAGVLEWGTVEILRDAGVGERMDREGALRPGSAVTWGDGKRLLIDVEKYTGTPFMAYGQTKIQADLDSAIEARGGIVIDEAADVMPRDVATDSPWVTYVKDGEERRIDCDFVAGCDGYHGVSRTVIPGLREYIRDYPFGWLGILSETPPYPELMYCNSPRGFALASVRTPMLSRYYLQIPLEDTIEDWPDQRFWEELKRRFPAKFGERMVEGPSVEKSIAPIRSYVAEPMRHGRLFLAGDAAHIVPPTGAKGLNLAGSDIHYLSAALIPWYGSGDATGLESYSDRAMARVWKAQRFSWWMTRLLHRFPEDPPFDRRLQEAEFDFLAGSKAAQAALAENYVGLAY
jgi:p-hydroxybenzoate 3-monooxygenase